MGRECREAKHPIQENVSKVNSLLEKEGHQTLTWWQGKGHIPDVPYEKLDFWLLILVKGIKMSARSLWGGRQEGGV